MILTRRFGGLSKRTIVTPPTEESKVRTFEDTRTTIANTETTRVERDDKQRTAA